MNGTLSWSPAFGKRVAWYLMRNRDGLFSSMQTSYYGIFIQVMKGRGIIGPRRAQGGYLVLTKYVANETQVEG